MAREETRAHPAPTRKGAAGENLVHRRPARVLAKKVRKPRAPWK